MVMRDTGVQLLLTAQQQAAVCSVLNQRVLERVAHLAPPPPRRKTSPAATSCPVARSSSTSGSPAAAASNSWLNSRPITAPIWATSLTEASRSRRAIKESCKRRRNGKRGQRAGQFEVFAAFPEQARFQHHLCQLFDEERHAFGFRQNLVENGCREMLSSRHRRDDGSCLCAAQPVQRQQVSHGEGHSNGPFLLDDRWQPA